MNKAVIIFLLLLVSTPLVHAEEEAKIRPFRIEVKQSLLDDLDQRLANTRWPDQIDETGWQYGIDLGYASNVFRAGHRVRLDISSSKFPHLARNQNTGNHPATDGRIEIAAQTIHHSPIHPAYVELSVAPGVTISRR